MSFVEQIEPSFKKVRGRSKSTLALIEAMKKIAEEAHPITGRGIGLQAICGRPHRQHERNECRVSRPQDRARRRHHSVGVDR